MFEVPAVALSGGIVILWFGNLVVQLNHPLWLINIIYASTSAKLCNILWDNLRSIATNYLGPWLVWGDFNEILSQGDKWGGRPLNPNRSSRFWS